MIECLCSHQQFNINNNKWWFGFVEAEEQPEISEAYSVSAVPYFVFLKVRVTFDPPVEIFKLRHCLRQSRTIKTNTGTGSNNTDTSIDVQPEWA
ncbi:hypothetical protein Hdeb2414_s0001g00037971 [Helianthus debilis subsp. tardiflorus]